LGQKAWGRNAFKRYFFNSLLKIVFHFSYFCFCVYCLLSLKVFRPQAKKKKQGSFLSRFSLKEEVLLDKYNIFFSTLESS